jgi:plastocyanin
MIGARSATFLTIALLGAVLIASAQAAVGSGTAATSKHATTATDFTFKIIPRTTHPGAQTFVVTNRGQATHDFKIGGKKTRVLSPGQRATLKITLKAGRYKYLCTVPGHAALGMKGTLIVR